ncbi:hypothetical protein [Hydrogenovibrio kuenenii]|uniref:hypothetical protein n=1 Tax=Hydrogenovibrio kuenenii TaxID=63658 RepID=UPI0004631318|nr:hypothetical protein [Hydrogenovibrio kuenenii]
MDICSENYENRTSYKVPCLFSFHHKDEVLEGRNLGLDGFGVAYPASNDGTFHFHREQLLKNCYIQIEGETIYFSKVNVCWLETGQEGLTYSFKIASIIEPEKEKYKEVYEKVLAHYRDNGVLTVTEKEALDRFFV